jgi:MFS transporter, DHA2 family, multidrug resistance protein
LNDRTAFPLPILAVLTLMLSLATFMQVLDTTIANVSIPAIAGDLGVTPSNGAWVITAFAASNAIALPLTGWLAERFGEVRLFALSTLLFSFASMMCGLSPDFEVLIFWRVIQGAVAAPMMPLSQSLLLAIYPEHKKGLALAFWAMTVTIGPIAGPLLGGFITDNFNWPWIFFINVPIGIVSSFVVWELLKSHETETRKLPIDTVGLALLIIGVGSLQIMLDKGNNLDWFSSNLIVALAVCAAVALSFFIVWELYSDHPVVDLSLFKSRNFTAGTIGVSVGFMVFLGGGVVFPLWLQTQMGYTAFKAGYAFAAVGVFAFLLSPFIGSNLHRFNLRILVSLSFLIFAASYFWMADFTTQIDLTHAALPRLLMGAGMAMFFVPLTAIVLSELDPRRTASAMGLVNFLRILGGGVGTSLAVTLWERRGDFHHAVFSESLTPFSLAADKAVSAFSHAGIDPTAMINELVDRQAMTRANDDVLLLSAYIFLGLIAVVWIARPPFFKPRPKPPR